jgi:ABC-type sugar transport system ATPase subunit
MKVFDNIAFPLKIRRSPRHEIEKRVKEVAEALEIGICSTATRGSCRAASNRESPSRGLL